MERHFESWFATFKKSIAPYSYYIDFDTVYKKAQIYKVELNMLNSLIGTKNIKEEFVKLVKKYPSVIKCIPILLAVRESEIFVLDDDRQEFNYNFRYTNYSAEQYAIFMDKTGLFDLFQNHLINNCFDYVLGVECGLNSNARKNRGGHLMEDLVEEFIIKAGFKTDVNYFKEMYTSDIKENFGLDLSKLTNNEKTEKRFDYVIKTSSCIYGIETNFYASGGSKLNETARSYKMLAEESKNIKGFKFVRFTDGAGRTGARNNLRETFDVLPTIYNINDMKNGIMKEIFK